jgi:hypothetical protein
MLKAVGKYEDSFIINLNLFVTTLFDDFKSHVFIVLNSAILFKKGNFQLQKSATRVKLHKIITHLQNCIFWSETKQIHYVNIPLFTISLNGFLKHLNMNIQIYPNKIN